jgi:hypothetical protein
MTRQTGDRYNADCYETPQKLSCSNCRENPVYPGTDECVQCFVAICREDDPTYLVYHDKHYGRDPVLSAEWKRQSEAEGYLELAVRGARACA